MFLSKCRPLILSRLVQVPRAASVSLFHTQRTLLSAVPDTSYPANVSTDNNTNNSNNNNNNAALFAFGSRLGLQSLSPELLQRAVTHATVDAEHNNHALACVGKQAIMYYVTEYVHCKYPDLPVSVFKSVISAYTNAKTTTSLGHQIGLQHVMRWERPQNTEDSVMHGHSYAICSCINALVGALHQEKGAETAKKFVHDFIISNRTIDLMPAFRKMEAKRHLSALLLRSKREGAVSRLLSETGRHSSSPVFIVGVFSANEKLGEGFGSSLKMAEHRACRDALIKHYAREQKDFTLPSDAHLVDTYTPPVLGDTEAIV